METRYKSHLYVYLIICGALYVVFSTLRSGGDLQGWFKGVYFFLSLMVMVFAYFNIAKKGDKYIKTYHHEPYMTDIITFLSLERKKLNVLFSLVFKLYLIRIMKTTQT